MHTQSLQAIQKVYSDLSLTRVVASNREHVPPRSVGLYSEVSWNGLLVTAKLEAEEKALDIAFNRILDQHIAFVTALGDKRSPIKAYQEFEKRFPTSPLRPRNSLALGDYLLDELQTHRDAERIYRQITSAYPNSSEGVTARLRIGEAQFESGRYDEAYITFQDFLSTNPAHEQISSVKFLIAGCEQNLGAHENAIATMERIVKDYPSTDEAPRALYWLASHFVTDGNSDVAQAYYDQLTSHYPMSTYAQEARTLLRALRRSDTSP